MSTETPDTIELEDISPGECFQKLREKFPDAMLGIGRTEMWSNYADRPGSNHAEWHIYIDTVLTMKGRTLIEALALTLARVEDYNRLRKRKSN